MVIAQLAEILGAGDGNRTHVSSLGSWHSTTELHLLKSHVVSGLAFYHCQPQPRADEPSARMAGPLQTSGGQAPLAETTPAPEMP